MPRVAAKFESRHRSSGVTAKHLDERFVAVKMHQVMSSPKTPNKRNRRKMQLENLPNSE